MPTNKKKTDTVRKGEKTVKNKKKEGDNKKSKKVPFPYTGTPDCRGYWI